MCCRCCCCNLLWAVHSVCVCVCVFDPLARCSIRAHRIRLLLFGHCAGRGAAAAAARVATGAGLAHCGLARQRRRLCKLKSGGQRFGAGGWNPSARALCERPVRRARRARTDCCCPAAVRLLLRWSFICTKWPPNEPKGGPLVV